MASTIAKRGTWLILLIVALIVIDQVIKIMVKTNMPLYSTIEIAPWFKLHYIENNGMAFGMTFISKLFLSIFRVLAIGLLCYYIARLVRRGARTGYLVCLSVIAAGGIGNIIDSMFYGLIFSAASPYYVSYLVPFGQGYAPFLMGRVVDMFYFPLIEGTLPQWLPLWGGEHFVFFSPVFNFADACVTLGVISLLIFFQKDLAPLFKDNKAEEAKTGD